MTSRVLRVTSFSIAIAASAIAVGRAENALSAHG